MDGDGRAQGWCAGCEVVKLEMHKQDLSEWGRVVFVSLISLQYIHEPLISLIFVPLILHHSRFYITRTICLQVWLHSAQQAD